MIFEAKPFTKADYPVYSNWLSTRGRHVPKLEELPADGLVAFVDSEPIAAGFIQKFPGDIAIFLNFASTSFSTKEARDVALPGLLDSMIFEAKVKGSKMAYASTNLPRFVERLQKKGFVVYDENIVQLGRGL